LDVPLSLGSLTLASPDATLVTTGSPTYSIGSIDIQAGTLKLDGGSISGGRIQSSTGVGSAILTGGSTLVATTLASQFVVQRSQLRLKNGLTLDGGTVLLSSTEASQSVNLTVVGSQTIGGNGVIVLDSRASIRSEEPGTRITLGPAVQVRTGAGVGTINTIAWTITARLKPATQSMSPPALSGISES
jgi:hypothetical protein